MRNIPDVALIANNVWCVHDNGTSSGYVMGTSIAAPLWAGLTALMNQQAATMGRPSVGFLNPAIYAIGASGNYTADFHDITTGSNTWSGSPNQFYAVPGYDLCTGWGTPAGQSLINALAGPPDTLVIIPASGFAASGAAGGPFNVTTQNLLLTNVGCGFTELDARQHDAVAQCVARQRHACFRRPSHCDGGPEFRGLQSGDWKLLRQCLVHQSNHGGWAALPVYVASLAAVGGLADQWLYFQRTGWRCI